MTRRRVLFVDDEPNVLAGLRRGLHGQRRVWDMVFATGGEEALASLEEHPADVVVSDMRMPGMDGGQLLSEVRRRHPQTARIILSGHADRASIVSAIGPTQQYLAKPCDIDLLISTVERVLKVRDLVTSPHMRAILGSVETLPKPPSVYEEMIALSTDPDCRLGDVVTLVEEDVATTTELLRLVNSAFFGIPSRAPTVERAVALLGLDTIQALALAGAVFRSETSPAPGLDLKTLSDRGLAVGYLAKRFAQLDGWEPAAAGDLFLAGLMHEMGLLVLAGSYPDAWDELRLSAPVGLDEQAAREREVFGCSVTDASAYLLGLWGFSEGVVHSVAGQPAPPQDLGAAPDAQILSVARRITCHGTDAVEPVTGGYIDQDRLARWVSAVDGDRGSGG